MVAPPQIGGIRRTLARHDSRHSNPRLAWPSKNGRRDASRLRRHLSSHTSSKRRLLYWLLSCGLKFFTWGCQQLAHDARTRGVFDQQALDIPDDPGSLVFVEFTRLRGEQPVDVGVAISRIVAFRLAGIILDDIAVGIVDGNAGDVEPDGVFLFRQSRIPTRRIRTSSRPGPGSPFPGSHGAWRDRTRRDC
jgi:hypothetical protein